MTGYWIYKEATLPIGTDMDIDIHKRILYGPLQTIFDVGANVGQTWEWLRRSEPGATIYCFEPVRDSFMKLKGKTNKDRKCITENIALGDLPGQKTIRLFTDNSALNSLKDDVMNVTGASEENITVDTLDNYSYVHEIKTIDLLKIDTEGYELKVLEGAVRLLKSAAISFIFCEVGFLRSNNRNTYLADLTEWLAPYDYYFFGLYQLVSNGTQIEFGNALFVHKDVFKT